MVVVLRSPRLAELVVVARGVGEDVWRVEEVGLGSGRGKDGGWGGGRGKVRAWFQDGVCDSREPCTFLSQSITKCPVGDEAILPIQSKQKYISI